MAEKITVIKLEDVFEPGQILRVNIDMEAIRELAESIREQGLLQPILVRSVNGKYEVVAGHRRYLAHKLIDMKTIKTIIRELDDEQVLIIRAMENLQREDLTPMEEARVYGTLRDQMKYTIEDIARKMGRNRLTIKKYLGLLELPPEFQKELNSGRLGVSVAAILAEIEDPHLKNYYFTNAVENGCSMKTAQLWVSDYNATKAAEYYQSPGGVGGLGLDYVMKPTYYACDTCFSPVDLAVMKHLAVCPLCAEKLRSK